MIKFTLSIIGALLSLFVINSCMVRTVTGNGGQVLYERPVHGTPWESSTRRNAEVQATERSLGIHPDE